MSKTKLMWGASYAGFALMSLLLSLYWTFPADVLAQRLARELQRQTQGVWTLNHTESSLYGLTGLRLSGVRLALKQPGREPWLLSLDRLQARLRLTPLLRGRIGLDGGLEVGGGSLSLRIALMDRRLHAVERLRVRQLDLARPALLGGLLGLPVRGKLDAEGSLALDADVNKMVGDLNLSLAELSLGPGAIAGLSIPQVGLGDIGLDLALKEGRAKLLGLKQTGGQIAAQLSGSVQLRQPLPTSMLDACVQFRPDPDFLKENPTLRSVVQLAEVQLRRDGGGFLHAPLVGFLNAPRLGPGLCR